MSDCRLQYLVVLVQVDWGLPTRQTWSASTVQETSHKGLQYNLSVVSGQLSGLKLDPRVVNSKGVAEGYALKILTGASGHDLQLGMGTGTQVTEYSEKHLSTEY